MLTVILGAGHSRRFRDAGWPSTKPMLPMPDGRTLLEWQVEALQPEELLYVGRKEYQEFEYNKIFKIIRSKNSPDTIRHAWLETDTNGPMAGLWEVRKWLKIDRPVLIVYCDTLPTAKFAQQFIKFAEDSDDDAAVVAKHQIGNRWTTVPDTDFACMGMFWFRSGKELVKKMTRRKRGPADGAPVLVYAFDNWGFGIAINDEIVDLGVPVDYKIWMAKQGCPVEKW